MTPRPASGYGSSELIIWVRSCIHSGLIRIFICGDRLAALPPWPAAPGGSWSLRYPEGRSSDLRNPLRFCKMPIAFSRRPLMSSSRPSALATHGFAPGRRGEYVQICAALGKSRIVRYRPLSSGIFHLKQTLVDIFDILMRANRAWPGHYSAPSICSRSGPII